MEITKNTMVRWINASMAKPSADGEFLCKILGSNFIAVYLYSAEKQCFGSNSAGEWYTTKVSWWAQLPELEDTK